MNKFFSSDGPLMDALEAFNLSPNRLTRAGLSLQEYMVHWPLLFDTLLVYGQAQSLGKVRKECKHESMRELFGRVDFKEVLFLTEKEKTLSFQINTAEGILTVIWWAFLVITGDNVQLAGEVGA